MKGLLFKELILIFKSNKIFLILLPIFVLAVIFDSGSNFILLYISICLPMFAIGTMTFDEISHWNCFVKCLPVEKNTVLSVKYAITLFFIIISSLFIGTMTAIITDSMRETVIYIMIGMTLGTLLPCISIPLNLKFGSVNGRIYSFIFIGIIGGMLPAFFMSEGGNAMENLTDLINNPALLCLTAVTADIIIFIVSWTVSKAIYKTKDC